MYICTYRETGSSACHRSDFHSVIGSVHAISMTSSLVSGFWRCGWQSRMSGFSAVPIPMELWKRQSSLCRIKMLHLAIVESVFFVSSTSRIIWVVSVSNIQRLSFCRFTSNKYPTSPVASAQRQSCWPCCRSNGDRRRCRDRRSRWGC